MGPAPSRCVLCAGPRTKGGKPCACVECERVFCGTCKKTAMAKLRAKTWRCTACKQQEEGREERRRLEKEERRRY